VSVVPVSNGTELLRSEAEEEHEGEFDPHIWFDPQNVMVWTQNIVRALTTLDPENADAYQANGVAYERELRALDAWIGEQVAQVPQEKRKLVTDHTSFNYFARRYGFEQVGAVFPGYSTLAEPAAQDIARLEDAIRKFDVQAVFAGLTVNPGLARRVANDTGTRLVFLYSGSLSESGGPADSYLALMRYNTSAVVEALR
jgi:manganese/iron transport system substrate-binding protein